MDAVVDDDDDADADIDADTDAVDDANAYAHGDPDSDLISVIITRRSLFRTCVCSISRWT